MGSYGIGVSRLVGAIIEAKFNNNIMKWPKSISPFDVAIIPSLQKSDKSNYLKAEKIYNSLIKNGHEVLWDDRDQSAGVKFSDMELIGIPQMIIIGEKSFKEGKVELKVRGENKITTLDLDEIINKII